MKKTPPSLILVSLLLPLACLLMETAFAESDLPQKVALARYEPMMNKSPFAVATAVATPAATPNFAKDLYVANAARTEEGAIVTIGSSTDKNFKKYLSTNEPVDGYTVTNIEWSDKIGGTKVTITKDGQVATLTFNQALIAQPIAQAPPPQQQQAAPAGQPQPNAGVPQVPRPNFPRPAPIPSLPGGTPTPRIRGVIQKNPQSVPVLPNVPAQTPVLNATPVPGEEEE